MIYQNTSKFKFVNRHYNKILVLIPGWATDYRIFHFLDMPYDYIFPLNFSPVDFKKNLIEYLDSQNIKSISILGFSLGGFFAEEFASCYSERIDKLFLVGIRKKYKKHEIEQTIKALKKNKVECLHKFYYLCVSKEQQNHFWTMLFNDYYNIFSERFLTETLLYLGKKEINPKNLKEIKQIVLIHGEQDKIAPLNEALEIKNSLQNAEIKIVKNAGHFLFFKENGSYFYE